MEKKLIAFFGAILTLVMLILVLSFLSGMVEDVQDDALAGDPANLVVNESVTWTNKTFVALAQSPGSVSLTCSAVYNNQSGSDGAVATQSGDANATINSGNWTCTPGGGINLTDFTHPGDEINITNTVFVNYAYKVGGSEYNISGEGLAGLLNTSDQFGNMGTILAIVLIVSLLVGAFVLFQRGKE